MNLNLLEIPTPARGGGFFGALVPSSPCPIEVGHSHTFPQGVMVSTAGAGPGTDEFCKFEGSRLRATRPGPLGTESPSSIPMACRLMHLL